MTHPEDHLSDQQAAEVREAAEAAHAADTEGSYDAYLAEKEAEAMAAKGLIKVTKGPAPSRISLIKGKPEPKPYEGPMEIDL